MHDLVNGTVPPPFASANQTTVNTKFRTAVQAIVTELEQHPGQSRSIPQLHRRHQIKQRRLCDVINVFTAIGCASRAGVDEIAWNGRNHIFNKLLQHKRSLHIENYATPLASLFPPESSVGLTSLTLAFLMLFPAIRVEIIDLRQASAFFSRDTTKYKTTLCKLYQITLILGALGVTGRTENVCEIKILPPINQLLRDEEVENPMAIERLLNRPITNGHEIEARRAEFKRFSNANGSGSPPAKE
jgi:hypothetical protein